ncbi:MAG: right-handed parallel beta-helix repeat-containing protein [Acidobacteria bacterium]|nr:right-handed parallel beta-helix repeat-containing protein [Acidobacteriota bacterium]
MKVENRLLIALGLSLFIAASSFAATFTVTTREDVVDPADGKTSMREAVAAANASPGPDTIEFAIPPSTFRSIDEGIAMLVFKNGPFVLEDAQTTIDFSSQTTNMGDTFADGPEVGIQGDATTLSQPGIYIRGNDCVIKGLGRVSQVGYGVDIAGHRNRVIGCKYTGGSYASVRIRGANASATNNVIGGTQPGEGNELGQVYVTGENNVVIGNDLRGVNVGGSYQYGVVSRNNRIGGPTAAERNVVAGSYSRSSEGTPQGTIIEIVEADDTVIEGNYVGTEPDGMQKFEGNNGINGIVVRDAQRTIVRNNLIAGIWADGRLGRHHGLGIRVTTSNYGTADTVVEGNSVGLAADGVTPILTYSGIAVESGATRTRVAGNHVAKTETFGVLITWESQSATLTGNSIHDNGLLGIDLSHAHGSLEPDGVTPNDPGDFDDGANLRQNFPVLQSATTNGGAVTATGTLDSVPNETFRIELFANTQCDPSGYGEGQRFLGAKDVTTDANGHATFTASLPKNASPSEVITATATRLSTGDTSEFSACTAIAAGAPDARPSAAPSTGNAPLLVQFRSDGSTAPAGIASYLWQFGDGETSTEANPTHVYAAGTYTATLTITDSRGTRSLDEPVTVISSAVLRSNAIVLSGSVFGGQANMNGQVSVRDADGSPVASARVHARWTHPNGSTVTQEGRTDRKGAAVFRTVGNVGSYTLTVIDVKLEGYVFDSANSQTAKSMTVSASEGRR